MCREEIGPTTIDHILFVDMAKTGTKDFVYTCNNHIKVDRDQVGFRMFRDTTSEGLKGDSLLKGNTRFNT
jgi:hypothetical protein